MFTAKNAENAAPGRHHADYPAGLYLEVAKDGRSRRWVFRFTSPVTHRPTEAGLGAFPLISLADARDKAAEYRSLVAKGTDPIIAKRQARAADDAAKVAAKTLGTALSAYAQAFAEKGEPTVMLESSLRRHVPALLGRPMSAVSTQDVLMALASVQARSPKTAARVRAAVSTVFDYAIARGMHSGVNPASTAIFRFLVPSPPASVPHRMMPFDMVPEFYARLTETPTASRLCLAFLILTAARTQEALKVEWADIDLTARLWVVPEHKIKMRRAHKVPLSTAALALLAQARDLFGDSGFVFPGMVKGSPASPRALESLLHRQLKQPYAVHGFRAAFSTWANELTAFAFEDVELCLAHQTGNAVSRAYDRSEKLAKRAAILEAWGDYVTGAAVSNVVQFAAAR
jgi:integrase